MIIYSPQLINLKEFFFLKGNLKVKRDLGFWCFFYFVTIIFVLVFLQLFLTVDFNLSK